ncbi:MAG: hypothetical protein U9N50_01610 [Pseudomonadota bacterium]|nr:hypothetical protein [Pseudomonadota bacterium]
MIIYTQCVLVCDVIKAVEPGAVGVYSKSMNCGVESSLLIALHQQQRLHIE